jgi:hypothetical protein
MTPGSIEFYLPLGLQWEDKMYRKGHMHLATTADELFVQDSDDAGLNTRYRDILLLSRVIDDLDGLQPVTAKMIETLFEADFLFLQLLYKELNGETDSKITVACPNCGAVSVLDIPQLYKNMDLYRQKEAE